MAEAEKHILVYAVRHGTTDLNLKDAFRGPIDAPLDKEGLRDAHLLAHYFTPIELSFIVHSDKERTRHTAEIIAEPKGMKADLHGNVNLRAWNVGDLGGEPKSAENLEIVRWHVQHPEEPMPGGESLNQFKARVQPLIADAVQIAMDSNAPVLLVVHSSIIHEIGFMVAGENEHALVEPGGVAVITIQAGKLGAEPIFRPKKKLRRPDTIT